MIEELFTVLPSSEPAVLLDYPVISYPTDEGATVLHPNGVTLHYSYVS